MLLVSCQKAPTGEGAAKAVSPIEAVKGWFAGASDERPRVYCAIGPDAALALDCRLEVVGDAVGRMLILSKPDGGFRRVRVGPDGAMSAADGAAEPRTVRSGNIAGVAIENERYAIPLSALTPIAAP